MYPNLTPTLVTLLGIALAVSAFIAVRRPFLRRLALRQIARRRGEAALVVAGSVLGTAIIIGSLIVGDTLNFSVRQTAYQNLGPIDEIVSSPTVAQGDQAARRIERLRGDSDVDGLLTLRGDQAAVVRGSGADRTAEPRASVWEVDFAQAADRNLRLGPPAVVGHPVSPQGVQDLVAVEQAGAGVDELHDPQAEGLVAAAN